MAAQREGCREFPSTSRPPLPESDFYVQIASLTLELGSLAPCLVGNILVVVAFARFRKLRTKINALVLNLAISDMLVGLFLVPYNAVYALDPEVATNESLCLAMNACYLLFLGGSLNSMLLISLDRYFAVSFPFFYAERVTCATACAAMCFVWTTLTAVAAIPLLAERRQWTGRCDYSVIYSEEYKIATSAVAACEVAVNLAMYLFVARVALRQQQRVSVSAPNRETPSSRAHRRDLCAARSMLATNGLFVLCWSPYVATIVLIGTNECEAVCSRIYRVALSLGIVNSGINGFVYSWKKKDFNWAVRRLLNVESRHRRRCSSAVGCAPGPPPSSMDSSVGRLTTRFRSRHGKTDVNEPT